MKISVIIPVYKPDDEFVKCIDSLKKQTLNKDLFEVICVLNGEKKSYEEFTLSLLKNSKLTFKYFYDEKAGVSNARNVGIMYSEGDFVTFLDSDDWISDDYLLCLYNSIDNDDSFLLAKIINYDPDKNEFFDNRIKKTYKNLIPGKFYSHYKVRKYFSVPYIKLIPSYVAKKVCFNTNYSYGEDALYCFSLSPFLKKAKLCEGNCFYFVNKTHNSLSRCKKTRKDIITNHLKLLIEYLRLYSKYPSKYNFFFLINRLLAVFSHIVFMR